MLVSGMGRYVILYGAGTRLAPLAGINRNERRKSMRKSSNLILSLILIAGVAGCATHQTTSEVAYDRRTGEPVTVERRTTTTTESSEDTGVLSGTVNVIGEVISLPFRAVGGLVRSIF
jgi:hypothetical protein